MRPPDHSTPNILLSTLTRHPVTGADGRALGECVDLIARIDEPNEPIVTGIVIGDDRGRAGVLALSDLGTLSPALRSPWATAHDLAPLELASGELLLHEHLIGARFADLDAFRLMRVTDIVLTLSDPERVALVGVIPAPERHLTRLLHPPRWLRTRPTPIHWQSIAWLPDDADSPMTRAAARKLAQIHPARIADLIESASHSDGERIIRTISHNGHLEAEVFEELDDQHQGEFLASRADPEAAWVLAQMDADDAADALVELPTERRRPILDLLPAQKREKICALLQYHAASAGGMMSPDFIALSEHRTAREACEAVHDSRAPAEALHSLFITNASGTLIGRVDLVTLMRSDPEARLASIMERNPPRVPTHATLPEIAVDMSDFNLTVIAVVDAHEHPVGAITIDDIIDPILPARWRRIASLADRD